MNTNSNMNANTNANTNTDNKTSQPANPTSQPTHHLPCRPPALSACLLGGNCVSLTFLTINGRGHLPDPKIYRFPYVQTRPTPLRVHAPLRHLALTRELRRAQASLMRMLRGRLPRKRGAASMLDAKPAYGAKSPARVFDVAVYPRGCDSWM